MKEPMAMPNEYDLAKAIIDFLWSPVIVTSNEQRQSLDQGKHYLIQNGILLAKYQSLTIP